jgi:hypothetical protein
MSPERLRRKFDLFSHNQRDFEKDLKIGNMG